MVWPEDSTSDSWNVEVCHLADKFAKTRGMSISANF